MQDAADEKLPDTQLEPFAGLEPFGLPGHPTVEDEPPPVSPPAEEAALGKTLGRGLGWSLLNNAIARLGNFLAGIVVVRILSPHDYGTYAVGMVVLAVLLSMNELGVSVAVVQRKGSVASIAPTVMTLAIGTSVILASGAALAAPFVAHTLHAPDATGLIRLLVIGVVIDGMASVPNALITRAFLQQRRLKIDVLAFLTATPVTIGLAIGGYGAWSLGWGAIVGNTVTALLAYAWAPEHYRPGWNREAVREVLRFGLPLAGASLLLLLMLNVDYIVVGRVLGAEKLGFYLLAFNLCSWPITVISTAIRRVSLAGFARMHENGGESGRDFERVAAIIMAGTLPICVMLASFAPQTIEFLYGPKWGAAADSLRFLAVLSAGRIAVELTYDYLAAIGRSRSSLWLHAVWLAALVPALTVGAHVGGITGVAAGHAFVVVFVLLPVLGMFLHNAGVSLVRTLQNLVPVLTGCAVIVSLAMNALWLTDSSLLALPIGGVVCLLAYVGVVWPIRTIAREVWNTVN